MKKHERILKKAMDSVNLPEMKPQKGKAKVIKWGKPESEESYLIRQLLYQSLFEKK